MLGAIERLLESRGVDSRAVEPLPGDLSQRRYFRVRAGDGATLLAAHYPAEVRAVATRFAAARELLAAAGLRVPAILAWDEGDGVMLLEDLGAKTLYDLAREGAAIDRYLPAAIDAARRIAALDAAAVVALGSPPLDRALLARELAITHEHLLAPRGLVGLGAEGERFREALELLCERLAADPPRPCHRDFMVRNLLPLEGDGVAVIDFQDLRPGPPAYDLASLLNDSLFLDRAREESALAAVAVHDGDAGERDGYARAVAQRALKAAGTFARSAAAGKAAHVALIAPTLARAVPHLARLPETAEAFAGIRHWFEARLLAEAFC